MCGIAGIFTHQANLDGPALKDTLHSMGNSIDHRGPDDNGLWFDLMAGIGLTHQRLAIVDLTESGHQPMESHSGRYVIVFNGEIYNFKSLKNELSKIGYEFIGTSDTEVLLTAIEQWGVPGAIKRCVGMFAFAVWDRKKKNLQIARDRLGEKPLYYGWFGNTFLFGSELKTIFSYPSFSGVIDRFALSQFMQYCYVPAPLTIFKGIFKLPPGTYFTINIPDRPESFSPYAETAELPNADCPVFYWNPHEVVNKNHRDETLSLENAIDMLREQLLETISSQMFADVPLGAFLSGGIDSSTVVALMQEISAAPVHTFTIGFNEKDYNEARYAKEVARHLGTYHTELYVEPDNILNLIPRLPQIYDEPFADSSQLPTFLVAEMTRNHVTVSLSGDGGDELFSGYNRYFWGDRLWRLLQRLPSPIKKKLLPHILTAIPPGIWDKVVNLAGNLAPGELRAGRAGDKIHKLAGVIGVDTPAEMYKRLISTCQNPADVVISGQKSIPWDMVNDSSDLAGHIEEMMYYDMITYLPDDILVKNDRAAMAVSLETRMPFLDHRVVELAWKMPQKVKIHQGKGKYVLRQLLYQYVPSSLIDRPKMGFGIPISEWLKGPLNSWAMSLLSPEIIKSQGYFQANEITCKWHEHLEGTRNWQYYLWNVVSFQAWLEEWKTKISD